MFIESLLLWKKKKINTSYGPKVGKKQTAVREAEARDGPHCRIKTQSGSLELNLCGNRT